VCSPVNEIDDCWGSVIVSYCFGKLIPEAGDSSVTQRKGNVRRWKPLSLRHEGVWGSGCIYPHFLDLGTNRRRVVSFTPQSLYPRGKSPRYPLDRRLDGPQSQSERRGEGKILDPTGTRIRPLGRPAHSQSLYRLRYPIVFPREICVPMLGVFTWINLYVEFTLSKQISYIKTNWCELYEARIYSRHVSLPSLLQNMRPFVTVLVISLWRSKWSRKWALTRSRACNSKINTLPGFCLLWFVRRATWEKQCGTEGHPATKNLKIPIFKWKCCTAFFIWRGRIRRQS
jgi:hypothetical protein